MPLSLYSESTADGNLSLPDAL